MQGETVLGYEPIGAAREAFLCRDRFFLLSGPVRTGKSRADLEKCHALMLKHRHVKTLFVRQTMQSLRKSALQTYEDDVLGNSVIEIGGVKRLARELICGSGSRESRTSYRYPNGSHIDLVGMADINRVLSTEYDLIFIQQLEECLFNDVQLLRTRLTGSAILQPDGTPFVQMMADCNPGPPTHWILEQEKLGFLRRFDAKLTDNPRWFNHQTGEWTPAGKALMEDLNLLQGHVYKRAVLGEWVAAEGARFPQFDYETHRFRFSDVFPNGIPFGWRILIGVDYGIGVPYCCLWMTIAPNGDIYVYREDYVGPKDGHVCTADEQVARMIMRTGENEIISAIVPDPTIWDSFPKHQINERDFRTKHECVADYYQKGFLDGGHRFACGLVRTYRSPERRKMGLATLDAYLTRGNGYPDLYIEENCECFMKEIIEAIWWRPENGIPKDDIDPKCADHAITAFYYPAGTVSQPSQASAEPITPTQILIARRKEQDERARRQFQRQFGARSRSRL